MSTEIDKHDIKITIPIDISSDIISSMLCTAIETSIYYWCVSSIPNYKKDVIEKKDFKKGGKYYDLIKDSRLTPMYFLPLLPGGSITFIEDDESNKNEKDMPHHTMDVESIKKGLKLMAEKYPFHFKDLIDQTGDASTADVLVQLSIFGEIVYG